jgi:hypothetical protein
MNKINSLTFLDPRQRVYGILKAYAAILEELIPVLHNNGAEPYSDCDCKRLLAETKHAWIIKEEHKIWEHARRMQPLFRTPEKEESRECWVLLRYKDYTSQEDEDQFIFNFDFEGYYDNVVRGVRIPDPVAVVSDMYYCLLYLRKRLASERPSLHWNNKGHCNCLEYIEREYPEDDWRRRLLKIEKTLASALIRKKVGGFRGVPGDKYMRMVYGEEYTGLKCDLQKLRYDYHYLMRGLDKVQYTYIPPRFVMR